MTHPQPSGYLALPASGQGSPVLVLHPWWGLNETIRAFCRKLAAAGFVAFAPDLYHGKLAVTIPEAEALVKILNADPGRASAEIAASAAFLGGDAGLAVVGFSLGAYFALELASADPARVGKVVLFYGTGDADATRSRAAYLGHFAANDPYEETDYVNALEDGIRSAGREVTFHYYPGTGHWFFEADRADAYNPEAAKLAWERTLAFLSR